MVQEIGIVETRKIVSLIKEKYDYDFHDFALTTFKRRITKAINLSNFNNADDFINRLGEDKRIFDRVLETLLIDETEMFRDPSLWRELRDRYFKDIIAKNRETKIWMIHATSGDELFTLGIVLKEMGILDKAKIIVTCLSDSRIERIKNGGGYELKKIEVGEANYKRYSEKNDLKDYCTIKNNKVYLDQSLIKNVEFVKHNLVQDELLTGFKIIFCRNIFLYFNQTLQERMSSAIYDSLMSGGYLILGGKETLDSCSVGKRLKTLNAEERIYKKGIA